MVWMIFTKILKNTIQRSNKKVNLIVTELFFRGRKLNISLDFVTQYYIAVPKNTRLNSTYHFIIKIPSKRKLQQIAFNYLSDIDLKDFKNIYKKCTTKRYSFLFIDVILASYNPLNLRKIGLEKI